MSFIKRSVAAKTNKSTNSKNITLKRYVKQVLLYVIIYKTVGLYGTQSVPIGLQIL
jgi:hypothetical protein